MKFSSMDKQVALWTSKSDNRFDSREPIMSTGSGRGKENTRKKLWKFYIKHKYMTM